MAQTTAYSTRDVTIPAGRLRLSARLYVPAGVSSFPVVVLVAGSGNESVIGDAYTRVLATSFTGAGIGVLAYDKRGTGASTRAFTGTDFPAHGADAAAAVRYARQIPASSASACGASARPDGSSGTRCRACRPRRS